MRSPLHTGRLSAIGAVCSTDQLTSVKESTYSVAAAKRGDIEAPRLETVTMPAIEFDPDLFSAVDVAEGITQAAELPHG